MIDWSSVFDEAYSVEGASAADLDRFVATVGLPLTSAEINEINGGQRNPFPKGDPLYTYYRPFDPSLWVIPRKPLPCSYLEFLRWSNGGEFGTGERWFQFFPALDPSHGVRAMLQAYNLPEYMPGALPIGFSGGGTFYLLDMRQAPKNGEYPVVCVHSGDLCWDADSCIQIGETLEEACRGTKNVDDLC